MIGFAISLDRHTLNIGWNNFVHQLHHGHLKPVRKDAEVTELKIHYAKVRMHDFWKRFPVITTLRAHKVFFGDNNSKLPKTLTDITLNKVDFQFLQKSSLPCLRQLTLISCQIDDLEKLIGASFDLESLSCSACTFFGEENDSFPNLIAYTRLTQINFSKIFFRQLSDLFFLPSASFFPHVRSVSWKNNTVSIPRAFLDNPYITKLDLSRQDESTFPRDLKYSLPELQLLILDGCGLSELPTPLEEFAPNLRRIDAWGNSRLVLHVWRGLIVNRERHAFSIEIPEPVSLSDPIVKKDYR